MYMHELIPFPLAVGDLGTRLALTIVFFVAISAALRSRGIRRGYLGLIAMHLSKAYARGTTG